MIQTPLSINLKTFTFSALDYYTVLHVTSCQYATLIPLDDIINAESIGENVKLIKNSKLLNSIRIDLDDSSIGILLLRVCDNTLTILITDADRDINLVK